MGIAVQLVERKGSITAVSLKIPEDKLTTCLTCPKLQLRSVPIFERVNFLKLIQLWMVS